MMVVKDRQQERERERDEEGGIVVTIRGHRGNKRDRVDL